MSIWFTRRGESDFAGLRAGWRLAVFVLILLGVPRLLRQLAPGSGGAAAAGTIPPAAILVGEAFFLGWLALVTLGMALLEERPWGAYGLPWKTPALRQFGQGAAWGAVAMSVLILLIWGTGNVKFTDAGRSGASLAKCGLAWLATFLLVGLYEEFRYRGYALVTLGFGLGFWPAAVLLSAAFGASHLHNLGETWMGALVAGLLGLFFCFTWRRTGTLWFAVGMHTAWDFCQSFVFGVPDSGLVSQGRLLHPTFRGTAWATGGSVGPEGSLWVLPVIVGLFALFAIQQRPEPTRHWSSS